MSNSANDYLRKADSYYKKAIELDKCQNYADALISYEKAKQVYESVSKYQRNDVDPKRLNIIESNLQNICKRIKQLNDMTQNFQQQQVQIMYPQVPVPPASYAGGPNFPQNSNYMAPSAPLYNQLPSLAEISSSQASPQTSYPQFSSAIPQQEANQSQQQQKQYFYQQSQLSNQIPPQQNQNPAQFYPQPPQYQTLQQPPPPNDPKSGAQSNPPLQPQPEDNHHLKNDKGKHQPEDNHHLKNDKGKHFHLFKKKNKSETQKKDDDEIENDKETGKKKKHDKKLDEKNQQIYDAEHQKQKLAQQPESNQYLNKPQQNWQQQLMHSQRNQNAQKLLPEQLMSQQQHLMQSQVVQQPIQQMPTAPSPAPQSQLYQMPPQSYQQQPPSYQVQQQYQQQQYQIPQHFNQQQQQAPSREISIDPQRQNNIQFQSNSDSVSYDSGYDYSSEKEKDGHSSRKRVHHVLVSDQIIQPQNYSIKRILGRGANGIVYLVSDVHTGKEYAMKELTHQLFSSEDQKSFFREIEVMIHANHPAVLKMIGFSMTNLENKNSPILILELMPNGSLQDVIEKKKKFSLTQKYIALYGIAEAMKYLHSKDNVHRDLKPANVLLNQNDEPVVADFGLSKLMSQELMRQTQAAGSPVYMAPELMMRQDYNNSIDVYAYGYICYELLLEELSFNNINSVIDLVNKVCNGARPPLNNKNLHEKWKMLISSCWNNSPYERPTFHHICQQFLERDLPFNDIDMNKFIQYEQKMKKKKV